jgi:nicotinamidase-related amidase
MRSNHIDPRRTAVLSLDLQSGIVSIYAPGEELVGRAADVLQHSRRAGATIIHVKVGFRAGLPEISERNMLLGGIKSSPKHQQLFLGATGEIHPKAAPEEGDIVITKSRVNAFAGTDLELVLRARDIDTLVLFGIATSGVVLSTMLHASDADYRLFIIRDCCADLDATVHSCLMDKVFLRQATVLTAGDFLDVLKVASGLTV